MNIKEYQETMKHVEHMFGILHNTPVYARNAKIAEIGHELKSIRRWMTKEEYKEIETMFHKLKKKFRNGDAK